MRINIEINDELISEALEATGLKSKTAVVELGLKALIRLKGQENIRGYRGYRGKLECQTSLEAARGTKSPRPKID